MDLDPRYLHTFFAVARAGGFSRAAATLHKTQPAVSYQIRQLEQQLGATLFDRTTRRPTLTRAGARLFALCERFFGEFATLAATLSDAAGIAPEPVRIAAVSGFGRHVLFPRLATLPATQPYSLRFPTAEAVLAALTEGACDVGFVYMPLVSSRLHARPAWREELVVIAPPGTPRALPRAADELAARPCVTYDESEYVFGAWFAAVFGRQPRSLRALHHFEELEEVVATVAAGRGWSIVPDHCVGRRTVVLRHARRRVRNTIYAVTRAGAPEHPAIARILDALGPRSSVS